jgi:hypothetical protein
MDFQGTEGFYASPFPNDSRTAQGFPNPFSNALVTSIVGMVQNQAGFGLTSGVFFSASGPIDPKGLPSLAASTMPGSPVVLIGIDPSSPDYLKQHPISVAFLPNGGPYGAANLLALLPLQGAPLRPKTRYAAVVTTALHDAKGAALAPMTAFTGGARPKGISDAGYATYQAALTALSAAKFDVGKVAGIAAFTTGSPLDAMGKVVSAMVASPPKPSAPFMPNEVFPTFCVYSTTISMPAYQQGMPPYTSAGGDWAFDASGNPVLQHMEEAAFVVTVPRTPMPPAGYPVVVFSRTGAGGNRPLVDRGVMAMTGGPPLTAGTGPALYFANVGWAGSEIDGPLGGLRNPVPADNEDFTIFNVGNPKALRDNVRQSAAELALEAHILDTITIDVSNCPGAGPMGGTMAKFDVQNEALMGHSMGATISPLALAFEPRFKGGLLSGAGGSLIENIMHKLEPLAVLGLVGDLVAVPPSADYSLNEHDPIVSMIQWACEPSDPPIYARRITLEPEDGPARNVLMMQGIVDHYIMPPIANAVSLAMGLDLAGGELDNTTANAPNYVLTECGCDSSGPCANSCMSECNDATKPLATGSACATCLNQAIANTSSTCVPVSAYTPVGPLLSLVGASAISLPVTANLTTKMGKVTAVLTQNQGDGIEDGHEVVFQTDGPKHQYGCFLKSLLTGMPTVPTPGKAFDPCN